MFGPPTHQFVGTRAAGWHGVLCAAGLARAPANTPARPRCPLSRAEELGRHAQAALLKLTQLKAGGDEAGAAAAAGRLDRESQQYRAELDANLDLNPALSELMFARHVMNKLESSVFALRVRRPLTPLVCALRKRTGTCEVVSTPFPPKDVHCGRLTRIWVCLCARAAQEEDAMKAAEFAAAHQDVTSTRAEMEELLDSHQGVVHKMKALQDKARSINESLQEKARALDEATAAVDELEAKADRLTRQLDGEKRAHAQVVLSLSPPPPSVDGEKNANAQVLPQ